MGDWVAVDRAGRIEAILPRRSALVRKAAGPRSALVRKAAGPRSAPQLIAANVDWVFVVTSANADFNPRRIERYLAAIADGGASPVLLINKTDLCSDVERLVAALGASATRVPILRVSASERRGGQQLATYLRPQTTIALVGSSGVGKSTIINWLLDGDVLETGPIREHDARGRHTTTYRELIVLPGGAALIDTPGMREFAMWSDDADVASAFGELRDIAARCRFSDCQHRGEPGCAVAAAIETGALDPSQLSHYGKLVRELAQQEQRGSPAARQATRRLGRARNKALREQKRQGSKLDD